MKKLYTMLVSVMLVVAMAIAMLTGCGTSLDTVTIAVAINQYDAVSTQLQHYYEDYLASELNIKFIFSEPVGDAEAIVGFVENAYASGAQAVMDFATTSTAEVEVVAARCNDLGLYFTTYYQGCDDILAKYSTSVAGVVSEYETLDTLFAEQVKSLINDGEKHSMVLCPLAAQYGNVQQTLASIGAINAFREVYGFTMSDAEISSYVTSSSTKEIDTDVEGVAIAINPLFTGDSVADLLKNGKYDIVVVSGNLYNRYESAILEAEKTLNFNIKIVTMTGLDDATQTSFNTKDPFGNASLDIALLTPATRAGATVGVLLNALYGDIDAVYSNGKPVTYAYPIWACTSAEQYTKMGLVDTAEKYYMFTADEVKMMVKQYNDDVNATYLQNFITEYGSFASVESRRGL